MSLMQMQTRISFLSLAIRDAERNARFSEVMPLLIELLLLEVKVQERLDKDIAESIPYVFPPLEYKDEEYNYFGDCWE